MGDAGEGTTRAFVMFAVNDKDTSELVSLLSQVAIALCDEKVIETLLNTESEAEIFTLFNRKGAVNEDRRSSSMYRRNSTYLYGKGKVDKGAKARGHECVVETQGTIGTEHKLTSEQIAEADVVILAVDVKISGEERFKGKPVIRVGTAAVIKNAIGFIEKSRKSVRKQKLKKEKDYERTWSDRNY